MSEVTSKGRKFFVDGKPFCEIKGRRWQSKFGPQYNIKLVFANGTERGPYPYMRDAVKSAIYFAQENEVPQPIQPFGTGMRACMP